MACHISQGGGVIGRKNPLSLLRHYFGNTEAFTRAYPVPKNGLKEQDLFEGVGFTNNN
jgi:hypothetical protein